MKHGVYLIKKDNFWYGEIWNENKLELTTIGMMNKKNVISRADKEAHSISFMRDLKIPSFKETQENEKKLKQTETKKETKPQENNKATKPTEIKKKEPTKPKRKPFTPYGLKGYLVDKGNIRITLDRRCNAKTITLDAVFFNQLADMVKTTLAM